MKTFVIWQDAEHFVRVAAEKAEEIYPEGSASYGTGMVRFLVGDRVTASFRLGSVIGWSVAAKHGDQA